MSKDEGHLRESIMAGAALIALGLTLGCSSETPESATTDVTDVAETVREIAVCVEAPDGSCSEGQELAFGDIPVGETRRLAVQLRNSGGQSERVDSVTLNPKALQWRVVNGGVPGNLPYSLAPGETLRVEVVAPAGLAPGTIEASTLTIRHALGPTELSISVSGHVLDCIGDNVNCDSDWTNACEANLDSSKSHCGGCDQPCQVSKGKTSCSEGKCTVTFCNDGYFGMECSPCPGDETVCSGNGTCNDSLEGDGICACDDEHAGDDCNSAADPCAVAPCDPMATCTATTDTFECACQVGYTGSGVTCEPCSDSCAECDGPESTDCTACQDDLQLTDGACL